MYTIFIPFSWHPYHATECSDAINARIHEGTHTAQARRVEIEDTDPVTDPTTIIQIMAK